MITIIEAKTKKEIKEFIKFPFQLYKNNSYWVPPLISDEMETFDKKKNPVFKNAEAYFYLAYLNNQIVGRVAAIINWDEVEQLGRKKIRFGWFETIDNLEVTKILIEKVTELGLIKQMDHIEGPMGFSNLDKVGFLTEGFDQTSTAIGWYTPPYYITHFEQLGFKMEKKFIESDFSFNKLKNRGFYLKFNHKTRVRLL